MTLSVADRNGASKMFFYYACALIGSGYKIKVLYGDEPTHDQSYLLELAEMGAEVVKLAILNLPIPPFSHWIMRAHCKDCVAIIGFHQRDRSAALYAAKSLGVPGFSAIGNEHHFWGPFAKLKGWYYGSCLRSLAHGQLICTSGKVQKELNDRFGIHKNKTVVLENGIEVLANYRAKEKLDGRKLTFITVGRIDYQKGLDVMIRAWALSGAAGEGHTLKIVGGVTPGNLNAASKKHFTELQQLVEDKELQDSVQFLGHEDDIQNLLINADVYLHTARWEGFPLAVLEGMAAALPVILTEIGATPTGFTDKQSGFIVASENTTEIANAITSMSRAGEDFRLEAGNHCRDLVEKNYDIQAIGLRFVSIIERFLK